MWMGAMSFPPDFFLLAFAHCHYKDWELCLRHFPCEEQLSFNPELPLSDLI